MPDRFDAVRAAYEDSGLPVRCETPLCGEETVACRDGVRLRVFWYRPTGEGPFPAVVQRSCYPGGEPGYRLHGEELARRGIAYLCQFCRGTGGSEGEWEPNVNEPKDGADFLRWVESLPWVKSVGYWGCSYLAATGWLVADSLTPKVKSMLLTHYGTERFTSAYCSGMFRHDILTAWAMDNAGRRIEADYLASCRYRPQLEVDTALWGGKLPWYRDWISSPRRTDPYWNQGFWAFMADAPRKLRLPVCIVEGWYDHHLGSALETFRNLSPEAAAHSTLLVGCWNHGFAPCLETKPQAHLENDETRQMLAWFRETLLEEKLPPRRVRWYVIGEDAWREAPDLPKPRAELALYLDAAARALKEPGAEPACRSYVYDPDDPVPSHGAESLFATSAEVGSRRQPGPDYRPDVLSFLSAPLEEDLSLLGEIRAELFVSSTAPDTAFTAKLMEVAPDGTTCNIRGSIVSLAYDKPYTPGETRKVTLRMWAVAWRVAAGSRLRLDVSSSDFPQYAAHSNYAGLWSAKTRAQTAVQTVFTGESAPSRLLLPLE